MSGSGNHFEGSVGWPQEGLLSVDVDAQLRKLPGRRNLSRHHYPVELVRGALFRGARKVSVAVSVSTVEVRDDGAAPAPLLLTALAAVFDVTLPDGERTGALEVFEEGRGLELLAAFSPEPCRVEILSAAEGGSRRITFERGRRPVDQLLDERHEGTRIRIRRSGNPRREREAVADHCRFAAASIELDGRPVAPAQPPEALAATRVNAAAEHGFGVLWIPAAGDVCRVRMLREGIVWKQAALPARLGFLFQVALEGTDLPSGAALENLRHVAEEQYRLLVRRYRSLDAAQQDRVDELLFLLHRRSGESELLMSHAPFRLRGSEETLPLAQVISLAREAPLVAVRAGTFQDRPGREGAGVVLALTERQREFLATDLGLQVMAPAAPDRGLAGLWARLSERVTQIVSGRFSSGRSEIPDDLLSENERAFVRAVCGWLAERAGAGGGSVGRSRSSAGWDSSSGERPLQARRAVFVDAAGHRPWSLADRGGEHRLCLHRRHRLTQAAVAAFARNSENLRLFLALLGGAER